MVRLSRQARQKPRRSSAGTSQLQSAASALAQGRQRSPGREAGSSVPSGCRATAVRYISPGRKPSGAPHSRQAAFSKCSISPQERQIESFTACGSRLRPARAGRRAARR